MLVCKVRLYIHFNFILFLKQIRCPTDQGLRDDQNSMIFNSRKINCIINDGIYSPISSGLGYQYLCDKYPNSAKMASIVNCIFLYIRQTEL